MKTLLGRLGLGCALALPTLALAEIYRCVSPGGETSYSNTPCPDTAAMSSNISAMLDHCTTAECEAQREQARLQARQRLKEERELLHALTQARLKTEALHLDRLVRLEQLRALEEGLALDRLQQAQVYYPAYGFGGGWPAFGPGARTCKPPHCGAHTFKPGSAGKHKERRLERPLSVLKRPLGHSGRSAGHRKR